MTRKQRRGIMIGGGVGVLALATLLVLIGLSRHIDAFYTPSGVLKEQVKPGIDFRLGGLVAQGSVKRGQGLTVSFAVTDTQHTIPVSYSGILPDLFREGQGVIAYGRLDGGGQFIAASVLAKHDETYMPPEVAKALKEQGVWQDGAQPKKK
ncbi:MAG: cytochrome c maturation protein CcmE [Hyphomicrobiales bacterium]|nr:cytochrome c maturation protein CcmE [Hyphomicrobiales bacterium]